MKPPVPLSSQKPQVPWPQHHFLESPSILVRSPLYHPEGALPTPFSAPGTLPAPMSPPLQLFLAPPSPDQSTAGIAFRHGDGGGAGILARGPRVCTVLGNLIPLDLGKVFTGRNPGCWHWKAGGFSERGHREGQWGGEFQS